MLGQSLPPLTVDELMFAMRTAELGASHKMPTRLPEVMLSAARSTGPTISPTDIPENRAAFAMLDAFSDRDEDFRQSVLWRVFMVDRLAELKISAPFVRKEDDGWAMSYAFLHAVARCPMRQGKAVNRREFAQALKNAPDPPHE